MTVRRILSDGPAKKRAAALPRFGDVPFQLLQKLLLELIANAARAAGRGGRLHLTLARHGAQALLSLSGDGAQDSGRPLAELLLDGGAPVSHIPQPGEGAGIGLALVQRILTLHGGALVMERQGGVRTTVSLPTVKAGSPMRVDTPNADYSGGFSPELSALSDLLPDRMFAPQEL